MDRNANSIRVTSAKSNVWLSPSGEFFDGDAHENRAKDILKYIYNKEDDNASDILEKLGWVRLTGTLMWDVRLHEGYYNRNYTQAQLNSMYEWCEMHHKEFPTEVTDLIMER